MDAFVASSLPLVGVVHFLSRPVLWKKVISPCFVSLCSTLLSTFLLLSLALNPQRKLFDDIWGWPAWLSWISAVLAVLAEVAVINIMIFFVLYGCTQSEILRSVLEERGVLQQIRSELGTEELPENTCCRDFGHSLVFLAARLPLLILTLPLNVCPVVGQILWCVLMDGYTPGSSQLSSWLYWRIGTCKDQWSFVWNRFASFLSFGAVAMLLEIVPVVGPWILFASNACGAALIAERIFSETHVRHGQVWTKKTKAANEQAAAENRSEITMPEAAL